MLSQVVQRLAALLPSPWQGRDKPPQVVLQMKAAVSNDWPS